MKLRAIYDWAAGRGPYHGVRPVAASLEAAPAFIDHELPVGQADAAITENGQLVEPEQRAVLAELLDVLLARAGAGAQAQAA